jgi:hypothetical protein
MQSLRAAAAGTTTDQAAAAPTVTPQTVRDLIGAALCDRLDRETPDDKATISELADIVADWALPAHERMIRQQCADAERLIALEWAESVAWHAGTIIIPITGPDGRDAEVSLDDTAQAVLLADMLRDAAGQPTDTGPTDWGPGGTEWTVGFTYPDGQHVATLDRYTEAGARHSAATWHGDPGEHAMPLRRQVGPWVEAEQSAPLPGDAFRADLARELRDPKFRREFTAELTRIDATQTPPTTWIHEGVTYDLTQPLVDGDGDTWHHTGWSTSIDGYRTMPRFTWTDADPEEHGYRGWRLDLIDAEHGPLTQPDAPDA